MNRKMLGHLQVRVGRTSVGPSTARSMGPPGTVEAARQFLQTFDIRAVKANTSSVYRRRLDAATDDLVAALPMDGRHWGSARKFFNIFIRNCAYNRFLCEAYRLDIIEPWMEVPLDSHVAKGLKIAAARAGVSAPRWHTVIGLDPVVNDRWQALAQSVAVTEGIYRVHLDVLYWNSTHMQKQTSE